MERQHVIIVGAGAAGLYAASQVSDKCKVTIIDANSYIGGRMHSIVDAKGQVIEAGAEFIHGDTPITLKLLKEANIKTDLLNGKMLRKEGKEWHEEEEMIEGWDELVEKMKGQKVDITMEQFIDENFPGERYAPLREHIKGFVQGFDLADISEVSVHSLYQEWSNEGEQRRVAGGYMQLVKHLTDKCNAGGCKIITETIVKKIIWTTNNVTIETDSGQQLLANKVIVTLPVSVLKSTTGKTAIQFSPSIDDYRLAAGQIGFGTVVKVIFDFKQKIWKDKTGFIFSNGQIPTWWTQYPADNNLITGWAGGPLGATLGQHTDDELIEIAIGSLSNIFDTTVENLRNIIESFYVFNWSKNEESLGAYSFSTPDSLSARKVLNEPLENTLFFAGEGLYNGPYGGTVEAALSSGYTVAKKLLDTL